MCHLENTVGTEQRGDPEKLTLENDQRLHSEQSPLASPLSGLCQVPPT